MKNTERKSLRMNQHDYSSGGSYYITICVQKHLCLFGNVVKQNMILNDYGNIANDQLTALPKRYPDLELNEFVVMPNHVHLILTTIDSFDFHRSPVGSALAADRALNHAVETINISSIIGAYKSLVYNKILDHIKSKTPEVRLGKLWQKSFHDKVIHDYDSYMNFRNYIIDNPKNWKNDEFYR